MRQSGYIVEIRIEVSDVIRRISPVFLGIAKLKFVGENDSVEIVVGYIICLDMVSFIIARIGNIVLTNLERVADHCSNVAGLILEMSAHGDVETHQYLRNVRAGGEGFKWNYKKYLEKYSLGVGTPPEGLDE